MIEQYEEERKTWQLKLITNVYVEANKLLMLKRLLNLSLKRLADLKAIQSPIIDRGTKTRLDNLAGVLNKNGIKVEVLLAEAI